MKNKFNKFNNNRAKNFLRPAPSMLSLDNAKALFQTFNLHAWRLFAIATGKSKVSPRLRRFNKFLYLLLRLYRHHGSLYTIKYLKACHMAIQKRISSFPFKSLREIEPQLPLPRLVNGLPNFIGSMDRSAIRRGNPGTIRLWLTICSVYRVLDAPMIVKLNTITDPFKGSEEAISYVSSSIKDVIVFNKMFRDIKTLKADVIHRTLASGPNNRVAFTSIVTDALAIARFPDIYNSFKAYCMETDSDLIKKLDRIQTYALKLISMRGPSFVRMAKSVNGYANLALGKLAFKEEAAGKLRIFAIVDIWTQSLMKPLHEDLFSFLRRLPNDGTFDQDASFARCLSKSTKYNCAFSLDLSSATDRLPIKLQGRVIDMLYQSTTLGTLWAKLLVDRPYVIRNDKYVPKQSVKYATGQPMGCLSSWAMLAVTHHFIVQHSAFRMYGTRKWFDKYEILGDDLVIFDYPVYVEYMKIMKELDVGINPSKSLISIELDALEFAKRTGKRGIDVSGLSWKQLITEDSFHGRVNFALSMLRKGLISSPSLLFKAMIHSHYVPFETILKTNNLRDLIEEGVMSILGSFAESAKISLKSAVALLVNPAFTGEGRMSFDKLPLVRTLQWVINIAQEKGNFLEPPLKDYSFREELAEENFIPMMIGKMYLDCLSKATKFAEDYDSKLWAFARSLVNTGEWNKLSESEKEFFRSIGEMDVIKRLGLRDPVVHMLQSIGQPDPNREDTLENAWKMLSKVNDFVHYLDHVPDSKAKARETLPWIMTDIRQAEEIFTEASMRPRGNSVRTIRNIPR